MIRVRALLAWVGAGRFRLAVAVVVLAAVLGLVVGLAVSRLDNDDRLIVGNTGGTLSIFIRVNQTQIVIGGGDSRSDLADLVGRSTLPWHRGIDLLVVPGWDDRQAVGALGLLERGQVRRLVIVGEPGTASIWTLLEEEAHAQSAELLITSDIHRAALGDDAELVLSGTQGGATTGGWALANLRLQQVYISFVDASTQAETALAADANVPAATHLLIVSRPLISAVLDSEVMVGPRAERSRSQLPSGPRFTTQLALGERLGIGLAPSTLRIPLDRLDASFPQAK